MIYETWRWLIHDATQSDIIAFPPFVAGQLMARHEPAGKDYFYRFWGNQGSETPRNVAGAYCKWNRLLSASRIPMVKNWHISQQPWTAWQDENCYATWFIDPPYQGRGGGRYRKHDLDYTALAEFARTRKGQVICCDCEGATWLPFQPLAAGNAGQRGQKLGELIWTND